jgi:hypothetical protein
VRLSDDGLVRIEVGLEGGHILSTLVKPRSADALEKALSGGADGALTLEAEDGDILLLLPRVLYAKRFAREGRVGFEV